MAFDDLSWTCYNDLATSEIKSDKFSIYPNPIKNNMLFVKSENLSKIKKVEILQHERSFSSSGRKTLFE